jgi:hypothetical protein
VAAGPLVTVGSRSGKSREFGKAFILPFPVESKLTAVAGQAILHECMKPARVAGR